MNLLNRPVKDNKRTARGKLNLPLRGKDVVLIKWRRERVTLEIVQPGPWVLNIGHTTCEMSMAAVVRNSKGFIFATSLTRVTQRDEDDEEKKGDAAESSGSSPSLRNFEVL